MGTIKVEITLTPSEYATLQEIATASKATMAEVVTQCVKCGMPPSLQKVPEEFHDELLALNGMSDRKLMDIVSGHLPPGKLDDFHERADFRTLRRTYAFSLLRWRGHPVPDETVFG